MRIKKYFLYKPILGSILFFMVFFSTATLVAAAQVEVKQKFYLTGDGRIRTSFRATYLNAHDAVEADAVDTPDKSGGYLYFGQRISEGFHVGRYKLILFLSMSAKAIITAATLYIFGCDPFNTGGKDKIIAVSMSGTDDVNKPTIKDFSKFTKEKQSDTEIPVAQWGARNVFPLNAAGISNINKDGVTLFGLTTFNDMISSPPVSGSDDFVFIYPSQVANKSKAPYIEITYICDESEAPTSGDIISVQPINDNATAQDCVDITPLASASNDAAFLDIDSGISIVSLRDNKTKEKVKLEDPSWTPKFIKPVIDDPNRVAVILEKGDALKMKVIDLSANGAVTEECVAPNE